METLFTVDPPPSRKSFILSAWPLFWVLLVLSQSTIQMLHGGRVEISDPVCRGQKNFLVFCVKYDVGLQIGREIALLFKWIYK